MPFVAFVCARLDLYTLLLEDILVLLQKQDERLLLKFHSKNAAGAADAKLSFSPVVKLGAVLVRPVATSNRPLRRSTYFSRRCQRSKRRYPVCLRPQTKSPSSCCPCRTTGRRSTS